MCCCFKTKEKGTRYWLCLFIFSILCSIIAVGLAAAVEIICKGPVPTKKYDDGSKVLYAGNVISFACSIICIVIIVQVITNRIVGVIALGGLVIAFFMQLYCIYCLAHKPHGKEMSDYVTPYYKTHKKAPPMLDMLQEYFGCCGGQDYTDYLKASEYSIGNKSYFNMPESCCKEVQSRHVCGDGMPLPVDPELNHIPGCGDALEKGDANEHEAARKVAAAFRTMYLSILIFGIFKIMLAGATIGIFVCYYIRFNLNPAGPVPSSRKDIENPVNSGVMGPDNNAGTKTKPRKSRRKLKEATSIIRE